MHPGSRSWHEELVPGADTELVHLAILLQTISKEQKAQKEVRQQSNTGPGPRTERREEARHTTYEDQTEDGD